MKKFLILIFVFSCLLTAPVTFAADTEAKEETPAVEEDTKKAEIKIPEEVVAYQALKNSDNHLAKSLGLKKNLKYIIAQQEEKSKATGGTRGKSMVLNNEEDEGGGGFLFTVFLLLILVAPAGVLFHTGMWSTALRFFNVLFAALIATGWHEAFAGGIESVIPSFTQFCDFLALWIIFCLVLGILETATKQFAKSHVKFDEKMDKIGAVSFGLLTGWVLAGFIGMSAMTLPFSEKGIQGALDPDSRMLLIGPERAWIRFAHNNSTGKYSRLDCKGETDTTYVFSATPPKKLLQQEYPNDGSPSTLEFRHKHANRRYINRANLQNYGGFLINKAKK